MPPSAETPLDRLGQVSRAVWVVAIPLVVAFFGWLIPQASYPASPVERFDYEAGYFAKVGDIWVEQRNNATAPFATYIEERRDKEFIYLVDANRIHEGKKRKLHIRIPVSGGMGQYAWDSPTAWENLLIYLRPRR